MRARLTRIEFAIIGALAALGIAWGLTLVTGAEGAKQPANPVVTVTPAGPTNSSPIAMSLDGKLVWSVNPGDDSVSVIRTDQNKVVKKIKVGDEPRERGPRPGRPLRLRGQRGVREPDRDPHRQRRPRRSSTPSGTPASGRAGTSPRARSPTTWWPRPTPGGSSWPTAARTRSPSSTWRPQAGGPRRPAQEPLQRAGQGPHLPAARHGRDARTASGCSSPASCRSPGRAACRPTTTAVRAPSAASTSRPRRARSPTTSRPSSSSWRPRSPASRSTPTATASPTRPRRSPTSSRAS